jgi:thymidylate kinase
MENRLKQPASHSIHRSRMKKLLEEGTTLIVDRYAFSGVAFTVAKHVSYKNTVAEYPYTVPIK